MTEVTFVTSTQGQQTERIKKISSGLMQKRPDVSVVILDGAQHQDLLAKFKLKYGPMVMIDGRMQFVGVPRLRMVLDKLDELQREAAEAKQTPATTLQSQSPPRSIR